MTIWKQYFLFSSMVGFSAMSLAESVVVNGDKTKMVLDSIEEVVVVGTNQGRYQVEDSSALTGFQLDYLELPRVVNVIPEQLIVDQKITDLGEALRNTAGVTLSDGFGGTNDDFLIRGFRRNVVYRNGFRRATNFKTNLTNTEYAQVIRGPASITYGQVEPGGLVDVVTKKPLDEARLAGEARVGSHSDNLFLLDWSQPLGESSGVRVVASTQDAESFRDFTDISRDTIAVSGHFALTNSTELDLAYEYRDESRPLDRGTVTVAPPEGREIINNLIDIPRSRRFGEKYEIFESEFHFFEASLEHELSESWDLRLGAAYEDSLADDMQARPAAVVILDADAPISSEGYFTGAPNLESVFDESSDLVYLARRTDGSRERDAEVIYLNAILSGEFETGGLNHKVAFGGDYRDEKESRYFVATAVTNGVPVSLGGSGPLLDLRNPIYGNLPDTLSTEGETLKRYEEESYGVFVNDYIELTGRLSVLLGLRYDEVEFTGDTKIDTANKVSPQVAFNYRLGEDHSAFFSYSEAFEPNFAVNSVVGETEPFEPESSKQFEVGSKAEFFDGRVQVSGALYRIEKTNVLTSIDGVPQLRDGQSSQGLELSFTGQPITGMNIVAGYAYTDAEIDSGSNEGNRPRNVAKQTFNLWTSYELQSGPFEGLGLGGGAFYSGDRYGDDSNSYELGSYTLVDLSAWYTISVPAFGPQSTMRFQLSAKNLFDEEYFSASGGNERISIGTPRTVFASVSFDL